MTSFSVRYRAARPCCRRNLKKSGEIPPRWAIRRGGDPHFFPEFGGNMVWVPGIFPKSCILEGGPITPCSRRVKKHHFDHQRLQIHPHVCLGYEFNPPESTSQVDACPAGITAYVLEPAVRPPTATTLQPSSVEEMHTYPSMKEDIRSLQNALQLSQHQMSTRSFNAAEVILFLTSLKG